MSEHYVWFIAFFCLGMLLGYVGKIDTPPAAKYVVVNNGQYMTSWADSCSEWTENPADAFHFSTYDIAESAALGVGGRVQEYKA